MLRLALALVFQVQAPPLFGQPTHKQDTPAGSTAEEQAAAKVRGEHFGQRVLSLGDIDGDHVPDFAVSDFARDDPENTGGRVWILSGRNGSPLRELRPREPERGWPARFGYALAAAGDIDRDGYPDFAVAALGVSDFYDQREPERLGYVRVYSGKDQHVLWEFTADNPSDGFGCAVDCADVDGDGISDVLVGAEGKRCLRDENHEPGYVRLYSGKDGHALLELFEDKDEWGWLGHSVCIISDCDGDGWPDLAVGSPQSEGADLTSGRVSVYSSRSGVLLRTVPGRKTRESQGRDFGWSIARAGDVDGDGVMDMLAACSSGYVAVVSGRDEVLVHQVDVPTGGGFVFPAGGSVCNLGDVDGDGRPDFAVGSEDSVPSGGEYAARIYSGKTGQLVYTRPTGPSFAVVGAAGDVDGDGAPDMLVGVWQEDRVEIVSAKSGAIRVLTRPTGSRVPSPRPIHAGTSFGAVLAPVGDLDGDGGTEVLVGEAYGQSAKTDGTTWVFSTRKKRALFEFAGNSSWKQSGNWVAAPGDLDADGVPDMLVVAEPVKDATFLRAFSGKSRTLLHELQLPYFTAWTWGADQILSPAGDVDRDGHADYVVLVTTPPNGETGPTELRTISGAMGATIAVTEQGEHFTSVVCAGDLDGDHVPELALGREGSAKPVVIWSTVRKLVLRSFESEGARESRALAQDCGKDLDGDGAPDLVYSLVSKQPQGSSICAWSLVDGHSHWVAKQSQGVVNFGALVAILGDLDGDGKREVLVGAPGMRNADSSAFILRGADGGVLRRHDFGSWQASGFGVSGCSVADLDGDEIEDYLIGESCRECGPIAPGCVRAYSGKSGELFARWYAEDMDRAR